MPGFIKILFLVPIFLFFGCGKSVASKDRVETMETETSSLELPLPVIPDSITDADAKRIYAGMHFWDAMDFNDTVKSLDDAFMEQNFANFIVFLNIQPDEIAKRNAIRKLLQESSVNRRALEKVKDIAKLYLADPNSPMRQEDLWIPFLEVVTADNNFADETQNLRYSHELEMVKKNQPGMKAANFNYKTKEGKNSNLYSTQTGSKGLVILFYDPECDHCKETITLLNRNEDLNQGLKSGEYKLLAVDVADDITVWKESLGGMPEGWLSVFNNGEIRDEDSYYFPALPVIYVVDKDFVVNVKR